MQQWEVGPVPAYLYSSGGGSTSHPNDRIPQPTYGQPDMSRRDDNMGYRYTPQQQPQQHHAASVQQPAMNVAQQQHVQQAQHPGQHATQPHAQMHQQQHQQHQQHQHQHQAAAHAQQQHNATQPSQPQQPQQTQAQQPQQQQQATPVPAPAPTPRQRKRPAPSSTPQSAPPAPPPAPAAVMPTAVTATPSAPPNAPAAGAAPAPTPTPVPVPTKTEANDDANSTPQPPPAKKGRTNTPWTAQEELRLKQMRDAGNSWAEIAKTFPTRTEGSVKKHWYKDMHYAEFAENESQDLLNAIKEYEASKWKVIGNKVGKPAKACEQYAKEHFPDLFQSGSKAR